MCCPMQTDMTEAKRRSLSLSDCTEGAVTMFSGRLFQSRIVRGKNEYFKVSVFALTVSNFEQWLPRVLRWARFTMSLCGTTTSSLTILNNMIHNLGFFCLVVVQTPAVSTVQLQFRAFSRINANLNSKVKSIKTQLSQLHSQVLKW